MPLTPDLIDRYTAIVGAPNALNHSGKLVFGIFGLMADFELRRLMRVNGCNRDADTAHLVGHNASAIARA